MAGGQIHQTSATDNFGEDEDEADVRQHQRLHAFPAVAQHLRNDDGDRQIEDGHQDFRAKSVKNLPEHICKFGGKGTQITDMLPMRKKTIFAV